MKRVGTCLYVHKSNKQELFISKYVSEEDYDHMKMIVNGMDGFFNYEVIKFDYAKRKLSLIKSKDWNTANEPTVGASIVYDLSIGKDLSDTPQKNIKGRNQIYHSKELFVANNYDGFDIEKAKARTKLWNSIPNIKEHKSRIGNRNYWEQLLVANGMEV